MQAEEKPLPVILSRNASQHFNPNSQKKKPLLAGYIHTWKKAAEDDAIVTTHHQNPRYLRCHPAFKRNSMVAQHSFFGPVSPYWRMLFSMVVSKNTDDKEALNLDFIAIFHTNSPMLLILLNAQARWLPWSRFDSLWRPSRERFETHSRLHFSFIWQSFLFFRVTRRVSGLTFKRKRT